jgi:hypothetical protein
MLAPSVVIGAGVGLGTLAGVEMGTSYSWLTGACVGLTGSSAAVIARRRVVPPFAMGIAGFVVAVLEALTMNWIELRSDQDGLDALIGRTVLLALLSVVVIGLSFAYLKPIDEAEPG